jgi:molybdopterin/thiamine biosynthesis adenylyltransferase
MKSEETNPFDRQSFLGENSQGIIERTAIGVVGLGGGGSHICQQLAHLGFLNFVLFDADAIEETNLNRLVGGTQEDVDNAVAKTEIARRLIMGVRPSAYVQTVDDVWQNHPEALEQCDIVFGCVDGFDQRRQLEATTRRYLIPLIDVGMEVYQPDDAPPSISGQVILSMPGYPCMSCMNFLNETTLAREAANYGDAGGTPQVVWSNGILASVAVGLAVDLLTDWSQSLRGARYLVYRGNSAHIENSPMLQYMPDRCRHYPLELSGPPILRKI